MEAVAAVQVAVLLADPTTAAANTRLPTADITTAEVDLVTRVDIIKIQMEARATVGTSRSGSDLKRVRP